MLFEAVDTMIRDVLIFHKKDIHYLLPTSDLWLTCKDQIPKTNRSTPTGINNILEEPFDREKRDTHLRKWLKCLRIPNESWMWKLPLKWKTFNERVWINDNRWPVFHWPAKRSQHACTSVVTMYSYNTSTSNLFVYPPKWALLPIHPTHHFLMHGSLLFLQSPSIVRLLNEGWALSLPVFVHGSVSHRGVHFSWGSACPRLSIIAFFASDLSVSFHALI